MSTEIESAAQWLSGAERIVVLTGAGVSAESGIPTFRDPLTGLWARHRPEDLATPEAFARNPELVWSWYAWRRQQCSDALPHAGHHALARLMLKKPGARLITQNVDGLHQRAANALAAEAFADEAAYGGARSQPPSPILELHGNIHRSICSHSRKPISEAALRAHPGCPPPSPHVAGAYARPDVVWFGEALPAATLQQAAQFCAQAQVLLVVGTSGLVYPAAGLPELTRAQGGTVIELNPTPTPISALAHVALRGTAAELLPRIC